MYPCQCFVFGTGTHLLFLMSLFGITDVHVFCIYANIFAIAYGSITVTIFMFLLSLCGNMTLCLTVFHGI